MEIRDDYLRYMVFVLADKNEISVQRIAEILNITREKARKFWFNYYDSEEKKDMACHFLREANKHDRFRGVQQDVEGQVWKA